VKREERRESRTDRMTLLPMFCIADIFVEGEVGGGGGEREKGEAIRRFEAWVRLALAVEERVDLGESICGALEASGGVRGWEGDEEVTPTLRSKGRTAKGWTGGEGYGLGC
jgi:hypothetical protein